MPYRILWIDNDELFLRPHVFRLEVEGCILEKVKSVSAGHQALEKNDYDLLILDVMLAVGEDEERLFPATQTLFGKKTGLIFYSRFKHIIQQKGIPVFVFTVREDTEIRNEFVAAGLPVANFMTKSEGSDTGVFYRRIEEIIKRGTKP